MRPTVRPILRALDACVFHHIVAFQCGHINFGSRRYKVYVCSQRSWPLIGAEIFVGKSVDGGMRNDSSHNVRGIAIGAVVDFSCSFQVSTIWSIVSTCILEMFCKYSRVVLTA